MEITTNEVEHCKIKAHYVADPEDVKQKTQEAVQELRKLQIPGFRKGKAPDYAIKARCKKQIKDWVAREMATQAHDDILFEKNIKPIGQPQYESINLDNNTFSCDLTILKKPDFELPEYKGVEVPKPHSNNDVDSIYQEKLYELRTVHGDIEPYNDEQFVEKGDQITMDFEIKVSGEHIEGSPGEGKLYTVGQDETFQEFNDNVLGMTPGEEREFQATLPESFGDLAGKTADVKVTVHMGTKKIPCELNDEFAQKLGASNVDDLKKQLRDLVEKEVNAEEMKALNQQVIKKLISNTEIELPEWLVSMEAQQLSAQNNIDWNNLSEEERELFTDKATLNVKLSLILDSIREAEPDSVLSDTEAVQALRNQIEDFDNKIKSNQHQLAGMVAGLKDEFTVNWLREQANITE